MQATPLGYWMGLWSSGVTMARSGFAFSEMMSASATVVDSRSRSILDAARDPLNGDYAELGEMVTEKIEAFSQAGAAAMNDVRGMQADVFDNWHQLVAIATGSRLMSPNEFGAWATRSTRMIDRAANAGGKALAPIHKKATANARRLKRAKHK